MLFTTPLQVVVLAVVLLGGWLLGYASAPDAKKWKRRVRQQSDSFTAYHTDAEDKLRAAQQRALDLKAENEALRSDHADVERTIANLRAIAVTPPVVAPEPTVSVPKPDAARHDAPPPIIDAAPAPIEPPVIDQPTETAMVEPEPVAPHVDAIAAPEGVPSTAVRPFHDAPEDHFPPEPAPEDRVALPASAAAAPATSLTQQPEFAVAAPPESIAEQPPASKGWFGSITRDDLTRIRGIDDALNTRLFGLGVVRFADIESLSDEDEMALEQRLAVPVGFVAREQWRAQAALLRDGLTEAHATRFGGEATGS